MPFRTYFHTSSFLLIATGFFALLMTGRLDPASPILYSMALAGAWWIEQREPELRISAKWAVRISGLAVPMYLVDVFLLGGNPFVALARFAFFLSGVKMLQVKADSDWVWLYLLTFCEVLLAAALTIDASFLVSLALFFFFFLAAVSALEITRSHRDLSRVEEETHALRGERPRPLRRGAFVSALSGAQLLLVAIVSVPIFLFMPRFGGGALGSVLSPSETLSGFSDSVHLGEIESIRRNMALVMYVTLDRPATRRLYWRGVVLDTYNGEHNTWSAKKPGYTFLTSGDATASGFLQVESLEHGRDPSDLLQQTVYLEPLSTRTLFAAPRVKAVDRTLRVVAADPNSCLRGPDHDGSRLTYTVLSDVDVPPPNVLAADTSTVYPYDIETTDTQLPDLDGRVAALAEEIVGDASTPFEKASRIEAYLKTRYSYTLDLRRVDTSIDPVADFLLNVKAGHCEYFASGMVLLLRSVHVPARLVNGFQMGEYNAITGSYKVRQADAHSWVEVYFAGLNRWVEFDPTPPGGINEYPVNWSSQFRQSLEALQMVWIRYVVTLDNREQVSIVRSLQRQAFALKDAVTSRVRRMREAITLFFQSRAKTGLLNPGRLVLVVVVLAFAGLLAFAAMVMQWRGWSFAGFVVPVWRWKPWWRRGTAPERSAVRFYEQMLTILSRHGLHRSGHETPREFAEACDIEEVSRITELYHRVRFGGESGRAIEREVTGALARLAQRLRRKRRAE